MTQLTAEQQKALQEKLKNMTPEQLKEFQKQQCIFCQIIANKIPSKRIYEDEKAIAILDINPAAKGHLLILPKEHYSIMPQIPEADSGHLLLIVKQLSQILLKVLRVNGTTTFIANGLAAGQKAQHFMIHLIPRKDGDKLIPLDEKLLAPEALQHVQTAVENRMNQLMGIKKEVISTQESQEPQEEPKPAKKKAEPKKKTPPKTKAQPKPTSKKKDEDVSLDDIANLFK